MIMKDDEVVALAMLPVRAIQNTHSGEVSCVTPERHACDDHLHSNVGGCRSYSRVDTISFS